MRYAKKKPKVIQAWELGTGSAMERQLIEEGAIRILPDGGYELFSREARDGRGEIARAGDYFKVDREGGRSYPFPNDREYFTVHHRHVGGDSYEVVAEPVGIWQVEDGETEELAYLIATGQLKLRPDDPEHYMSAWLWGAPLSAPRDATMVYYSVDRDEAGTITGISFNFVERSVFEATYEILP